MVTTNSRVWSDSGVEPAAGDEVYTGQERPIAEYDNWAMWAVTTDIDTIAGILNSLEKVEAVTRLTFDTEANRPAEADLTLADDEGWIYLELDTGRIYSVKDDGAGNAVWFQLGIGENDVGSTELASDAVNSTHVQTDAIGSAEIQANSVGDDELDLSISPTWTGTHTFDDGLSMDGNLDLAGNTLVDTTQGYYDLTDGNNLRLSTGNAIEDESGTRRVSFESAETRIRDESGQPVLDSSSDNYVKLNARSAQPIQIEDIEGGFTAVQYDTDTDAGVLRTPKAHINIQSQGSVNSKGLHIKFDGTDTTLQSFSDSSFTRSVIGLSGSRVDINAANLRLATGHAIEDGSGNKRVEMTGNGTLIYSDDDNGNQIQGIELRGNNYTRLNSDANHDIEFQDDEGSFTALRYTASSSAPGTLKLTGAQAKFSAGDSIAAPNTNFYGVASIYTGRDSAESKQIIFKTTGDEYAGLRATNGELEGQDDNGNTVILT